jgi:hypothetical protein
VTAPSKDVGVRLLLARVAGLNPPRGMSVAIVVCCQVEVSLRRADHSSRGILPTLLCVTEYDREVWTMRRPWSTGAVGLLEKKYYYRLIVISWRSMVLPFVLFCTMTNKCTIISQIITLLHVSTLSCHPQGTFNLLAPEFYI